MRVLDGDGHVAPALDGKGDLVAVRADLLQRRRAGELVDRFPVHGLAEGRVPADRRVLGGSDASQEKKARDGRFHDRLR